MFTMIRNICTDMMHIETSVIYLHTHDDHEMIPTVFVSYMHHSVTLMNTLNK